MITVLAGGTGSVKLVRGLVAQEKKVNVISNVGDNYWLYGLYVCPDIDTIIYGLADLLDQDKGWGIKKDTFNFKRQMEVFGEETWFGVGDRDAATHLIRTNMLKNGRNLSDITKWMCEKFAVTANFLHIHLVMSLRFFPFFNIFVLIKCVAASLSPTPNHVSSPNTSI